MTTVKIKKRSITVSGLLGFLAHGTSVFLTFDRKGVYRLAAGKVNLPSLDEYFPSVIVKAANKLERRGLVEKIQTKDGMTIKITDNGKKELLKYSILDYKPKSGKWDGKWRVVFFDIPMEENSRRDKLRMYLKMLGMKMMQESVWVSPYDIGGEIKYIREVLDIPHRVKLAEMSFIENEDELKEIFEV